MEVHRWYVDPRVAHTLAACCASRGSVPRKLTLAAAKEQPLSARLNTHDQWMSLTVLA